MAPGPSPKGFPVSLCVLSSSQQAVGRKDRDTAIVGLRRKQRNYENLGANAEFKDSTVNVKLQLNVTEHRGYGGKPTRDANSQLSHAGLGDATLRNTGARYRGRHLCQLYHTSSCRPVISALEAKCRALFMLPMTASQQPTAILEMLGSK